MCDQNKNILEQEKCYEIMKKKLRMDSMENFSLAYKFEPREEFAGFLGQYFNLNVILTNRRSKVVRKFNFFVKLLPLEGAQRDFVEDGGCFEIEHGLYTKIFPKMFTSMGTNCIPECFLGLKHHALVLEDMNSEGYKMLDKLDYFQLEHSVIVMKSLARFHAGSLIFEEKNKKTILDFCHEEKISINACEATLQSTLNCFSKNLICMVDFITEMVPEEREKYKVKITEITSQHYKKIAPSMKFKNVLCHADLWANNILFKTGGNEEVDQCCFIDFQMARYCFPAFDLLYFFHCTTSREFRKEKSEDLFKIYYGTLADALKEAQMDIATIFPWNHFRKSISDFKLSCMAYAFSIMSVSFLGMDASIQRTKGLSPISELVCDEFKSVEKYRNRMLDNLLDLYDNLQR